MELLYFKSKKGNFGDDLNPWLWPQLFDMKAKEKEAKFLGIGSILHNGNPDLIKYAQYKKIVFGTGIRPNKDYSKFAIDATYDIRYLRGPQSSKMLNDKYKYIADAAYCIRILQDFDSKFCNTPKKYQLSLMPYFHSIEFFDWEKLCKSIGAHYISPLSENGVEATLREIAQSQFLITEAMHGAILADILRVPWHRFVLSTPYTEGARISEFKWTDWQESIYETNNEISYIEFYNNKISTSNLVNSLLKKKKVFIQMTNLQKVEDSILDKLSKKINYSLSSDDTLKRIDSMLEEEINKFH
ncbi:hypothetical protein A9P82_05895 [Arachidicoccus ginsenosidimutans]|uniref:polysaccharide pyruvyl transferase family protein n=1 Tax=Arachidicoccus sp. BS20 TaxID=1850526 RepID=UPI0007F155FB|nr:polysaccharide pyruvyl transferase family protein [Arachidicoccus sp. BS20]ANI88863.1 hypothetical protein A9P82_05895 [Arachidicoccus sp. BS20]